MSAKKISHKVNHVSLVMDKSGSMHSHKDQLIRVVDEFVAGLKAESDQLGHETRISLYAFDHKVENLVWDMDVKHLPSMQGLYTIEGGATSLIEASVKSLDDLGRIWEGYGEHSFLQVVVTDGLENASGCSDSGAMHSSPDGLRVKLPAQLTAWKNRIQRAVGGLPDHWTSAILVPNSLAKRKAQEYGFPAGNIAIWDTDSNTGVEEAIGTVRTAATSFLRGREQGVRGTKNLFAVGQDLDIATVKANLVPLDPTRYKLVKVEAEAEIRPFVQAHGLPFTQGCAYYQLGPRVKVQASKEVAVLERSTDRVFSGPAARELLFGADGLQGGTVSVKAGHNSDLEVYVQSKSVNRKLKASTRLLVML